MRNQRLFIYFCPFCFGTFLFLSICLPSGLSASEVSIFSKYEKPKTVKLSQKIWGTGTTFLGQSSDSLPPLRTSSMEDGIIASQNWASAPRWTLFPDGLIFPSFLAGVAESRMGGVWNYDKDQHWIWDITLGGRAPLLRYGNRSSIQPEGWQLDIEGSVHLRLDLENEMDMDANDFRFGLPISYGTRTWQIRFGYYHVSSHMGDERMIRLTNAGLPHKRINYVREALIFGYAYRINPAIRLYAEADFAFERGEYTKKWHFQFGAEYSRPYLGRGPGDSEWHGSPFAAVNAILLEEHDFDGNINVQLGWQWRGPRNQMFRVGVQYFGGVSEQYEHIHARREHKVGLGVWYDF